MTHEQTISVIIAFFIGLAIVAMLWRTCDVEQRLVRALDRSAARLREYNRRTTWSFIFFMAGCVTAFLIVVALVVSILPGACE